jgi:hypothetical protein
VRPAASVVAQSSDGALLGQFVGEKSKLFAPGLGFRSALFPQAGDLRPQARNLGLTSPVPVGEFGVDNGEIGAQRADLISQALAFASSALLAFGETLLGQALGLDKSFGQDGVLAGVRALRLEIGALRRKPVNPIGRITAHGAPSTASGKPGIGRAREEPRRAAAPAPWALRSGGQSAALAAARSERAFRMSA